MGKSKEPYINPDGKIVDYFGTELQTGDIVVHGYRGEAREPFSCGVFLRENKSTLSIAKKARRWNSKTQKSDVVIRTSAIGKSRGLIQPVIIVSNPLFSLENNRIRDALEIIDDLIDKGILPKGFQAGVTNG